jgi:CheY-like chemotaxis protein
MATEKPSVLVVDDDVDTRDLVNYVLERHGFETLCVASAPAALEVMRRHPPDIVVTDLSMPGMDGAQLARTMRGEPGLAGIPLLVLSGVADAEDLAADLACEVLRKPVLPATLVGALRRCLGR